MDNIIPPHQQTGYYGKGTGLYRHIRGRRRKARRHHPGKRGAERHHPCKPGLSPIPEIPAGQTTHPCRLTSTKPSKKKNMNTITHSIKTPSLTEFDLAPYTGKAIQYICLDEQDLSKLSNQGFIHTTHSPIIKLEQTTPLLLYVRMFHQTKKTAATVHAIAATKDTLYLGIIVPPSTLQEPHKG